MPNLLIEEERWARVLERQAEYRARRNTDPRKRRKYLAYLKRWELANRKERNAYRRRHRAENRERYRGYARKSASKAASEVKEWYVNKRISHLVYVDAGKHIPHSTIPKDLTAAFRTLLLLRRRIKNKTKKLKTKRNP